MDIKRPSLSTFSTIGRYLKIIFLLCSFKVYFILTIFIFRFCLHFSKAKYNNYSAFISSSVTKNHETARKNKHYPPQSRFTEFSKWYCKETKPTIPDGARGGVSSCAGSVWLDEPKTRQAMGLPQTHPTIARQHSAHDDTLVFDAGRRRQSARNALHVPPNRVYKHGSPVRPWQIGRHGLTID